MEHRLQPPSPMRASLFLGVCSFLLVAACAAQAVDEDTDGDFAAATAVGELGEELEENEAQLVSDIAAEAVKQVEAAKNANPGAPAPRDAHPKAHGCVTGSFKVHPSIPEDMRVGTFQPNKTYDAWIRFSNGNKQDDREDDARGMAIKLLGVDGKRLLANEAPGTNTHDLVLTNHHTFFLNDVHDYVDFMRTVSEKGNPLSFFFNLSNPFNSHPLMALAAKAFTSQPISSPLTSMYFSATPYRLGEKAVKYSVMPCGPELDTSGQHADDPNFLSNALKEGLAEGGRGACFEFFVQRQTNNRDMPIEKAMTTWKESESPFIGVGKLRIPPQTFDSPEQKAYCENLSFTPWHATEPHRPLGRINRTRKVVYEATSAARHRMNGAPRVEPKDLKVPGL